MWKTAKLVRIHLAPTEITHGHCKLTPMLKTLKTYYNLQGKYVALCWFINICAVFRAEIRTEIANLLP